MVPNRSSSYYSLWASVCLKHPPKVVPPRSVNLPPPSNAVSISGVAPCKANQLSLAVEPVGAAETSLSSSNVLFYKNISKTACWLSGYPTVSFISKSGHNIVGAIQDVPTETQGFDSARFIPIGTPASNPTNPLAPGQEVVSIIQTTIEGRTYPVQVDIGLPGGGGSLTIAPSTHYFITSQSIGTKVFVGPFRIYR